MTAPAMAPGGDDFLIRAENVSKKFCRDLDKSLKYGLRDVLHELAGRPRPSNGLRPGEFWGLKDVSFELRKGESLGLLGRNGAGKSTLIQLLNGRMKLDGGRITVRGTTGLVTELGAGFNPVQTGRENVYNSGAVFGMSKERLDEIYGDIVAFAELEDAMDTPVQNYSSGMRARLGYAVVAHLRPDILMVDEVLAVGDIAFRRKCIENMLRYLRNGGSLVLVAHDMYAMQAITTHCLVIDNGRVVFQGGAVEGFNHYYQILTKSRVLRGGGSVPLEGAPAGTSTPADPASPARPPQPAPALPENMVEPFAPPARSAAEPTEKAPVVIDRLCIRGLEGPVVESAAPAVVEIHYRSLRPRDWITWAFVITTGDQLIQLASGLAGHDGPKVPLKQGEGVLSCRIPRLPLAGGMYVLKAGIGDGETKGPLAAVGWQTPGTLFTVRAPLTAENNIRATLGTPIVLDVVWDDR